MAEKHYKLPLNEDERKELESVYENIFLKEPHHNLKDENLLKAIASNDNSYSYEVEEDDKPTDVGNTDSDTNEDKERSKEYADEVEKFIKFNGVEPSEKLDLEALKLANKTFEDAVQATENKGEVKPLKPKKDLYANLVSIKKGDVIRNVNRATFDKFLSKDGWELNVKKPKELE